VISNSPSDWAERDETKSNQLFLIVEPSEATCGCATFGPTLALLESIHPQLPATFFHLFVGALNRWIRIYDYRDAEDRAETLREWAAQEPDADQYELPDVAGSIPPCMREAALNESELAQLKDKIHDPLATKLVDAVTGLDLVSRQAERPELDDEIGQQLSDCNPALPCLLAVFAEGDSIAGCFDEDAQGMMEVEPEPNIIIPFDPIRYEWFLDSCATELSANVRNRIELDGIAKSVANCSAEEASEESLCMGWFWVGRCDLSATPNVVFLVMGFDRPRSRRPYLADTLVTWNVKDFADLGVVLLNPWDEAQIFTPRRCIYSALSTRH
jgi:hypothetical protein